MMFAIAALALAVVRPPVATLADGVYCSDRQYVVSTTFTPGSQTALFVSTPDANNYAPAVLVSESGGSSDETAVLRLSLAQPTFEGRPYSLIWRVYNQTGFAQYNNATQNQDGCEMFAQEASVCWPGIFDCNVTLPSAGWYFSTLTSVYQSQRSVSATVQCVSVTPPGSGREKDRRGRADA